MARVVKAEIPPISLNFYRWLVASIVILPFAFKKLIREWKTVRKSLLFLFGAALTGVSLFNTFVYIGAHHTSAINLALIGTTSSPIMAVVFARIFLQEKISWLKFAGILLCMTGVLFLLAKGDFRNLRSFHFSEGDLWVLLAAFCFAIYNTLVKKRPSGISPVSFLAAIFILGTVLMFPFFYWEQENTSSIKWNSRLFLTILYLGIAASVFCFMIWNIAISRLGSGRTALFGNLIPIFSSLEAVIILHEDFTNYHIISMIIVFAGIVLANLTLKK